MSLLAVAQRGGHSGGFGVRGEEGVSITYFVCKGMQNTEGLIVQLAVTKQVVHKVRPKPRSSLSAAKNVAHSFSGRGQKKQLMIRFPLIVLVF